MASVITQNPFEAEGSSLETMANGGWTGQVLTWVRSWVTVMESRENKVICDHVSHEKRLFPESA
jgi:hypothetical protein